MKKPVIFLPLIALTLAVILYVWLGDSSERVLVPADLEFPQGSNHSSSVFENGVISLAQKDGSTQTISGSFSVSDTEQLDENFYRLFEAETSVEASQYDIYYDEIGATLLIALHSEPISIARENAVQALERKLSVTRSALCSFDVMVLTNSYVNAYHAGADLGVPGCPGAVVLE